MTGRTFRVDPHRALRRSLAAFVGGTVTGIADEPWSSVTFEGRRHGFRIIAPDRPGLLEEIGEVEFALPGHLVGDIAVTNAGPDGDQPVFVIEALTIVVD